MKNLFLHQHSIHQNSDTFSCAECNHATPRKSDLNRHIMKKHANASTSLNHPPKVARRGLASSIHPVPLSKTLNVVLDCPHQMYPTKFIDFFKRNNHGVHTKISVKFMCKISIAFATQKPSTDDQEPTFNISTTPRLLLIPLPVPLRISFYVKPTLSRSASLFLSFYNTGRLEHSDIIMLATTTSY